jgi:ribosomal protein L11 methylase PrmA
MPENPTMSDEGHPSSFRDPSGFLFRKDRHLLRQVNRIYQPDYDALIASGLYKFLTDKGWLIPHRESDAAPLLPALAYKVIQPDPVRCISYPYEWCFSQLKDAALLTLKIAKAAIRHGMLLKDASAYNIQYHEGKPVLIDTLSFEKYVEGEPWIAYRQFCQHFLAPLALMAHTDVRLNQLMRVYIDGIPLALAAKLLPLRTRFSPGLALHLHMHAGLQEKAAPSAGGNNPQKRVSRTALLGLIESLQDTARQLQWKAAGTEWVEYYEENNYTEDSFRAKKELVGEFLGRMKPGWIWDLGGNTGVFSRIAAGKGNDVICFDNDYGAVERNYLTAKAQKEIRLLPLVLDLTNPSPAIGWSNRERESFLERGPADGVLALAVVHHLAIGNNLPLDRIADFFALCGPQLIVEFIPKEDSQVRRLLSTRKDIFTEYTREKFEAVFQRVYTIEKSVPIPESKRILYLMKIKGLPRETPLS